jgi:ABC-type transporter Mla subunit MlaD
MAASNGNIDERLEALTMNLELVSHSVAAHDRQLATIMDAIEKLVKVTNEDATAIRALARLAEVHERRIADLESPRF